ncbi:MAG: AAC(3) family N-acetyltransferase [Kiritimatiellae bacterium]|nr:AAC(3) family N-acetyltransferase [Kiritimatiellia bacterium]
MPRSYDIADLTAAFRWGGLGPGDVVFTHSNIALFGKPVWAYSAETLCEGVCRAFREVIGPEGTLVVPVFTYSYCRGEVFNPAASASDCGLLAEWVRTRPGALRSEDPIFSVAALGPQAGALTRDVPRECFGSGSFWTRLVEANGWICNLNVFEAGSTLFHYVERKLGVPYRFDKVFEGVTEKDGRREKTSAVYFCRRLDDPRAVPNNDAFSRLAYDRGVARKIPVGGGTVAMIRARDVVRLIEETLPSRPWLLTAADGGAPEPQDKHA